MPQTAIFGPVIAQVLLTLALLGYNGYKRFHAGFTGRVKAGDSAGAEALFSRYAGPILGFTERALFLGDPAFA